jgi:beta-galactosamide-alpha-2,3-sialyltransferase
MNLIVCFTPFQINMALKVIEEEQLTDYVFVYYASGINKKNVYYYNILKESALQSFIIKKTNKIKDFGAIFLMLIKVSRLLGKSYQFYGANIKSFYSRIFLILFKRYTLITFDDGAGNIRGNGYFYQPDTKTKQLLLQFINPQAIYKNLINKISKHYTIYKGYTNVYPNTSYIEFNKSTLEVNNIDQSVRLLLTSPFSEDKLMNLNQEKELYKKIIGKYNITHYLSHPRETTPKIESNNIKRLDTVKLAEEVIVDFASEGNVIVYGIYTSVMLNIPQTENIKLINIDVNLPYTNHDLRKIYDTLRVESIHFEPFTFHNEI